MDEVYYARKDSLERPSAFSYIHFGGLKGSHDIVNDTSLPITVPLAPILSARLLFPQDTAGSLQVLESGWINFSWELRPLVATRTDSILMRYI